MHRLREPISQIFKERPASIKEAGNTHYTKMLTGFAENITCPWVQIWAEGTKLA
jgi:hypothetical protein